MDKTKKLCYNKYVIRNKKLITSSYAPIGKWFEAIALSRLHHGFESRWEYHIGEWRNWLAHTTDNREAAGSIPASPTNLTSQSRAVW